MKNQPIRILHVIGVMHHGGAETMIMNFYRHIDRSKVQFDFVENEGMQADFDEEILGLGGRIYHCPRYRGKNHFQYVTWWKNFLAQHAQEYRAVHGHIGSTASIYLRLAKKAGIYTIAHSHSTGDFSIKSLVYMAYAYPTRFIADYFFGCSKAAGESRYGKKVCSSPVHFTVLNNAIDTRKFGFSLVKRTQIRNQLGVSDKIVIGHVGRFVEAKNHEFLVRIFEEIHRRNPETVLLLLGDGELKRKIEKQVSFAGLSDCVIFAGVQNDVSAYYQAMDIFVMPSLFEGKPFVLIEAQTSGLPCVISEKVPDESITTTDIVSIQNLSSSISVWGEHILSRIHEPRRDHSEEVRQNGYDITQTVKWLENFYLEIGAR